MGTFNVIIKKLTTLCHAGGCDKTSQVHKITSEYLPKFLFSWDESSGNHVTYFADVGASVSQRSGGILVWLADCSHLHENSHFGRHNTRLDCLGFGPTGKSQYFPFDMQLKCWTNALSHHWGREKRSKIYRAGTMHRSIETKMFYSLPMQQFNLRKQLLFRQRSSQIYRWYDLFSVKIGKTFKVHGDNPLQLFLMQKCNWLEKSVLAGKIIFAQSLCLAIKKK